eukprot:TRINITY_DN12303_c0_g1_i10.p1 TRINITY_DN12303_c0_g1~~TRINITY_DN12303_c0_g1_i10.p1  ORF type:complete len:136 (-),score=23.96 TRINITY_DN12303_c0_g1_i10:205-612(-)
MCIRDRLLYLLDWKEVGMKLAGIETFDMTDMMLNTKYTGGYTDSQQIIQWFWEVIQEFDNKLKAQFLFFLTGSFRAPHGGFKVFNIEISKAYDINNLPVAHTCTNQLELPDYASKEILQDKLLKAIMESEGFWIV